MTTHRIDRILLALGALLILISSGRLFFGESGGSSGEKLGTLTSTLSVVKTKGALALDWRDASSGNDLTENQLIYTDDASSAEIVFNEGSSLNIGENSLVKLSSKGQNEGMNLSRGFIRATIKENQPLKIQMNGEDYVLSGKNADIQINLQDEKGEIGVLSGEVQVKAEKVSESLTPAVALNVEGDSVAKKEIYFKALTPENNSVRYVLNAPLETSFTWEPSEKAEILLSKKASLEKARSIAGESGVVTSLSPGLWYYRITSEKGISLIHSFRIIQETAPVILRPLQGDEVTLLEDKNAEVLLQWKGEERFKYLVEWSDTELNAKEVSGTSSMIEVDPKTGFKWRVKILDPNRPQAVWTQWQEIKTVLVPKPEIPTDLIPHEVQYQTYETPNEKIDFMWKGIGKFEIEIQKPDGEASAHTSPQNHFQFVASQAGTYSWRVRSFDDYLRKSEWTDWKTFTIEDFSGNKSEIGVQRIQLKKPDQTVTFEWESDQGATSVFELAKDADFKEVIRKVEVSSDSTKVNFPETGSFFWRSRQYLPDGKFHVSEPKKVIIEPVPAPLKPAKLPDMEVPLEEFTPKTTLLETIWNFIIPSAYAEEIKGTVHLTLPVKEEAKAYVVRIYRDKELTDQVLEQEINSKNLEWKNAESGEYYWQYAVIDYWDRRSLFSDPSKLTVKSEEVPDPVQPRLRYPIRAQEIELKDLVLNWTESKSNEKYLVEISETRSFKKIIAAKETNESKAGFTELKLEPKLYFWRVHGLNKRGKEKRSNTGRFVILPATEKTIIEDFPKPGEGIWKKEWKSRAFIAWAPSMDNYTFQDGDTGTISGNALMGVQLSGTMFREKYIYSAEILRQTGKVFEGESYLFQRAQIDGIRLLGTDQNHKWGVGLAVGQSSGMAYSIESDAVVAESVSGLTYGPVIRNFFAMSPLWQLQGRAQYLLGGIKQMEISADAIRAYKSYLLLGGFSYSMREYEVSSGKQTSIKITLGLGKEF